MICFPDSLTYRIKILFKEQLIGPLFFENIFWENIALLSFFLYVKNISGARRLTPVITAFWESEAGG